VEGPGLQPVFRPQSETNDIDPASQVFQDLLPPDQNEKQVAGQPATFDPKFMAKIDNYLAVVGEPTADVSEFPSFAEEDFLEAFLPNVTSSNQPNSEIIPSEVSSHDVAQEETSTGGSNVDVLPPQSEVSSGSLGLLDDCFEPSTTCLSSLKNEVSGHGAAQVSNVVVLPPEPEVSSGIHGLLDGYIVRPPQTFSNTLPTPVSALGEGSSHDVAQEEISTGVSYVESELMDFETSPQAKTSPSNKLAHLKNYLETFSDTLSTPVCTQVSFPVNTDRGIPLFSQVAPTPAQCTAVQSAPLRSKSVIVQGPRLADKRSATQPQWGNPMNTSVRNSEGVLPSFVIQVSPIPVQISQEPSASAASASRGKKVPKTNPERCQTYRNRQKIKKEKDEQELRQLDAKNRALKAKEADLRIKIKMIKEAARRRGLGNYFN